MPIVRELITKLGFKFDKSELDRYQRSVSSFKGGVVTTVGEIASAIGKTIDFFRDLADSSLSVKDISDYARTASDEFISLRQAAREMGISFQTFDQASLNLSKQIEEALSGTGKLFQLIYQSQGKIRFPSLTDQANNFKNVLTDIFKYVSELPTRADKLRVLQNIFQASFEQAGELLRAIDQGPEKFEKLIQSNTEFGKGLASNNDAAKKFKQELALIEGNLIGLVETIKSNLLPFAADFLEKVNESIGGVKEFSKASGGTVNGFFEEFGRYITNIFDDLEGKARTYPNVPGLAGANQQVAFNTSNNLTFNVPPGTSETQVGYMRDEIQSAIQETIDMQIRQVVNNNPMIE